MPTQRFFDRPLVWPSLLLSSALLFGLVFVGWGIANRGNSNTITATGSASQEVRADKAKWSVDVRRTVLESSIPAAYAQVARDAKVVENFFASKKLTDANITLSTVYTDQNYSGQNGPTMYNVHQLITVQTTDAETIEALSHNLSDINASVGAGTVVSAQPPEYYVSTLPELRVSLIGKAIEDAKARATQIAKSGGSSVGALQSASSGVVQVLAPNSTNVEDYGSYDTSTIQKQVMVTTRAMFFVE